MAEMTLDRAAGVIRLAAHAGAGGTIRPAELLTSLFGLTAGEAHQFRIVKTAVRSANFAGADDRKIFLG